MQKKSIGGLTLGLSLMALGCGLLLDRNFGQDVLGTIVRLWPVALILLGIEYLFASRDPENRIRANVPAILTLILVLCLAWAYVQTPYVWSSFGTLRINGFNINVGQERYEFDVPVEGMSWSGVSRLNVEAVGDVTVTGSDDDSVSGTATISVRARTQAEAKKIAEQVKVETKRSGSTLYIKITRQGSVTTASSVSGSFRLSAPASADVTVNTVSGDVKIEGLGGDVAIDTVSGDIDVDDSPGKIDVNTVSGEVETILGEDMDAFSASTVSGDVRIEAPEGTGGTVDFGSVSGGVKTERSGIDITSNPGRRTASGRFGTGRTAIKVNTISGRLAID